MGEIEHDEKRHRIIWRVSAKEAEKHIIGWKMLESNEISGFLPFDYYYIDDDVQFRYLYMSDYQRLEEYLKQKKLNFDVVFFLCRELLRILDKGQEYLLNLNACSASPEWIFWNSQKRKIGICFFPGREGNIQKDFIVFVEKIMQYMDYKDKSLVELVYGLYDRTVSEPFLPEQLLCYLGEFNGQEQMLSIKQKDTDRKKNYEILSIDTEKQNKNNERNVFKKSDKHCFLKLISMEGVKRFMDCLYCKMDIELPMLEKGEFVIGRDKSSAFRIPMEEISYRHAVLINEENGIYIMDTASKNGTYLNGSKISAYVKTPCQADDIITFADISYRIQIRGENYESV